MARSSASCMTFPATLERAVVHLAVPLLGDVGIDLGRADIGMPKQLLHDPQIRSVFEQMAGKGMTDDMR